MAFIVFEGLDGAGKSTQIKLLTEKLVSLNKKVTSLHFPFTDSNRFGVLIARFLRGEFGDNNEVDPYIVAALYAGDRFNFKNRLIQYIKEYDFVIVDRYISSNIAYQCAKTNNVDEKNKLKDWIYDLEYNLYALPKPDLTFFFDVPFSFTQQQLSRDRVGEDRDYLDGKADIHEKDLSFQEKVRNIYIELCNEDSSILNINCASNSGEMLPSTDIFERLWHKFSQL